MCGISGIITKSQHTDKYNIQSFSSFNKYRGPDEYGEKTIDVGNCKAQLAHHRLGILDLTPTGCQPMANEEGTVMIVYNGEVFNFSELRQKLEKEQVVFRGTSDTEVILKAYEKWGIEYTLAQLQGMFALCIVDLVSKQAYIARDPFGKKPLYYVAQDGLFAFSSDIRSFKTLGISLSIDVKALSYYFAELSTPGNDSIFNEVKKVVAGSYITLSESIQPQHAQFKRLSFKTKGFDAGENVLENAERLITDAVKSRLVADVPVVTFLSGGIDSGLVSAIAAQNYGKKISTYTVGYENYPFDERPFAKIVAEKYDTDHNEIILNPTNTDIIDQLIEEFGEPFADSSMIPSYYVCSVLSSKAKVALSGDGGDETFLGYPTYIQAGRMQTLYNKYKAFKFPAKLLAQISNNSRLKYLSGILNEETETIAGALYRSMGFSSSEIITLFKGNPMATKAMEREFADVIENGSSQNNNIFGAVWYGTFKTRLLNDYLVKVDRASMFASVEVRSPFLDDNLQAYMCSLPHHVLMPGGKRKHILKEIAKKYLPTEILNKPKTGFGIPVGDWFRTSWKNKFVGTVLEQRQTLVDLDYGFIQKLFEEHVQGKNHDHKIWALYVFHRWCHTFFTKGEA